MRFRLDPFIVGIIAAAAIASLLPLSGALLDYAHIGIDVVIAALFFSQGARLSSAEAFRGLRRWKLQVTVVATTFVAFPLLGLAARPLFARVLDSSLTAGLLLLCFLPSTVQSAIAMTSIARGNVAGAVVGASLSNVIGVFITPLLVAVFISSGTVISSGPALFNGEAVITIVFILLVPFILGQMSRRYLTNWVENHGQGLRVFDRAAIILVVYVAFSEGMSNGIWQRVELTEVIWVTGFCLTLLAVMMSLSHLAGRVLHLRFADQITLMFSGPQKSLSSGLPMASVLFDRSDVALIVLPLMIYHQSQLITASWLATGWGRRDPAG